MRKIFIAFHFTFLCLLCLRFILILQSNCESKFDFVLFNFKWLISWFTLRLSNIPHFCQFVSINTYEFHVFICRITTLIESSHNCWSPCHLGEDVIQVRHLDNIISSSKAIKSSRKHTCDLWSVCSAQICRAKLVHQGYLSQREIVPISNTCSLDIGRHSTQ